MNFNSVSEEDREKAREMLLQLGLKYYSILTESKTIDLKILKTLCDGAVSSAKSHSFHQFPEKKGERKGGITERESSSAAADSSKGEGATHFGRLDVLQHFPFNDDGEAGDTLFAISSDSPNFMDIGAPLRKRLAASVYKELCTGKAGLNVGDIPTALEALGFKIEDELRLAFLGRSRENPVSMDQWLKVVKRFSARENMRKERDDEKRSMKPVSESKTNDTHIHPYNQASNRGDGKDLFRNVHEELTIGDGGSNSIASKLQLPKEICYEPQSNYFASQYKNNVNIFTEISDESTAASAVKIADQFLRGPIGKEVYSTPVGWWDTGSFPSKGEESMRRLATELGVDARVVADGFNSDSDADESAEVVLLQSLSLIDRGREAKESLSLKSHLDERGKSLSLKKKSVKAADYRKKMDEVNRETARDIARRHEEGEELDGWKCRHGGWVTEFKNLSSDVKSRKGGRSSPLSKFLTSETIEEVVGRTQEVSHGRNSTRGETFSEGAGGISSVEERNDSSSSSSSSSSASATAMYTASSAASQGIGSKGLNSSSSSGSAIKSLEASVETERASASAVIADGQGTVSVSIVPATLSSGREATEEIPKKKYSLF